MSVAPQESSRNSPEQTTVCSDAAKSQSSNLVVRESTHTCWTDCIRRTEHNALFLDCDFSSTTLGHKSGWGPALRSYVHMVFADSRGSCIYWGPDKVAIYNEPFSVTAQSAHPFLMGHSFAEAFPELADGITPLFDQAASTGHTVEVDDIQLFLRRDGFMEESYFVGQFIPIRGDSGEIEGFYNTTLESTSQVLFERRRKVTDRISCILPHSVKQTLTAFVEALHANPFDITVALLYSFDELAPEGIENLNLEGSVGVPEGHRCAPQKAHLETGHAGLITHLREVQRTGQRKLLDLTNSDSSELKELFEGITWAGFGEPSRTIAICPLKISGSMLGFYVQGTNPRRQYDEAVERGIEETTMQLKLKWAESMAKEQAVLREQRLERQATESQNKLQSLARNAPLGMYQIGLDRKISWANDQFYGITGHDPSQPDMADFRECLAADEREKDLRSTEDLFNGAPRLVRDIRLCRAWVPRPDSGARMNQNSAWILAVTFPLMEGGKVKSLLGYVTDISRQKWAENVQANNAAIAIDARRRQEEFLDITSHELRNPLSAILQLADSIIKSYSSKDEARQLSWHETVAENATAASTILACATHQKRIIDDVLILSRLDSQMLSITRVAAEPHDVIASTLKMLESLTTQHKINVLARRGESAQELRGVRSILVDTSRLTQVLINLIGNAIKFTSAQPVRDISIVFGIQAQQPAQFATRFGDLTWVSSSPSKQAKVEPTELGHGDEALYAYFLIEDTGPGMTPEEMTRLFKRFSQATFKTQIAYGGSGLGLHICKQLTEKQGGGIGVASKHGEGSVFAFYLETRAATNSTRQTEETNAEEPQPNKVANGELLLEYRN